MLKLKGFLTSFKNLPFIQKSVRCISSKLSYSSNNTSGLNLIGVTVRDALNDVSIKKPNDICYKFCMTNKTYSFIELKHRVDEISQSLLNMGFVKGDRLAIMLPNLPETVETILAAASIGVVVVLMNPAYQVVEVEHMLKKTRAKGIVLIDQLKTIRQYEMLKTICPELEHSQKGELNSLRLPDLKHVIMTKLIPNSAKFNGTWLFSDIQNYSSSSYQLPYVDVDDPLALLFTSGSTGFPKAASISHHSILNTSMLEHWVPGCPQSNKNVCIPIPIFHMFGLCVGIMSSIVNGITTTYPFILPETVSTLKSIQNEKCTALKAAPVMFIDILNNPDLANYNLSSLESMLIGASTVPKDLLIKVKQRLNLKHVIIGYALTESGCAGSITRVTDIDKSEKYAFESIGQCLPHMEAKIIDPSTGITLPFDSDGEICLRGYGIMKEYLDEPEKTRETIDENKWLKTGDLGSMDQYGYLYFKSRIKELIIRGGINIYPYEVEKFIRTNENVLDCYVVGVPDARFGEELCAWIKLKPNVKCDQDTIKNFCKGSIAFYKIPKYIKFVDSFPINATGKVQKFKMQEQMKNELKFE